MDRVYNFGAGPAMLPTEVLEEAQQELLNWQGLGSSVMELSHRGKPFMALAEQIEQDLRELLAVPKNYHVLFVQGGGRGQFAMVPLNLLRDKTTADYINTGIWSEVAIAEAEKYCDVNQAASPESSCYTHIPDRASWQLNPDAAYVHIVDNETINGVEYPDAPNVGDVPLVADMSSNFLSRPFDVSQYGVCYAGAQKNIGPAGVTLVLVREDLLGHAKPFTPSVFDYANHAAAKSLFNTPPTFAWYVAGKVIKWLLKQGGLTAIAERNQRKASLLYDTVDQSDFYHNPVEPPYRSRMNVVFTLADESRNEDFLNQAQAQGLCYLKGHRRVGGMRASIYNAMPLAGVEQLVNFMKDFERRL